MLAQAVLDIAEGFLQDVGNDRWSAADLLTYLNLGRLDLCELRPEIYAARQTVTLVAGVEQSIPATSGRFLGPVCNVSSTGAFGRSVTNVVAEEVDAADRDWRSARPGTKVKHTMFRETSPRIFEVYPPVQAGTKLRIETSEIPTDVIATDDLTEEGQLAPALADFVVAMAFTRDMDIPTASQRAQVHYGLYLQKIGVSKRSHLLTSPNFSRQGGTPARELMLGASGG